MPLQISVIHLSVLHTGVALSTSCPEAGPALPELSLLGCTSADGTGSPPPAQPSLSRRCHYCSSSIALVMPDLPPAGTLRALPSLGTGTDLRFSSPAAPTHLKLLLCPSSLFFLGKRPKFFKCCCGLQNCRQDPWLSGGPSPVLPEPWQEHPVPSGLGGAGWGSEIRPCAPPGCVFSLKGCCCPH